MTILAIYNPAAGAGTAKSFFEDHVLPLLASHGKTVDKVVGTEHPGHAGEILVDFIRAHDGDVVVILGSGDSTLNECITSLAAAQFSGSRADSKHRVVLVLIPLGTANALFSSFFPPQSNADGSSLDYRLQSLHAFIAGSVPIPLNLAITTLSSPPAARKAPQARISAVVVSTSLHAAILRDSEELRAEMPGIERFKLKSVKVAAQKNCPIWYQSSVKLLPAPGADVVQIYDPEVKSFVAHPESDPDDDTIVEMEGPFSYFLATVNVGTYFLHALPSATHVLSDRLEPAFMITPLASKIPASEAVCDVVILRPMRSPVFSADTPEARAAFVSILGPVFGGAYQGGSHIDLRYNEKGEATIEGDGPTVIEYIRCGGWEWVPDDQDEDAHLLCTDGALSTIEKEGRAVCSAVAPQEKTGFLLHV
ncbi:unnamed protein product [Mycena citricolor]|uniref:DAGKc domain-containing protein n=1 Tax=Mycena citricolor TaxID=2018698 RepID=A0AAD2HPC5_9AGAR|nr:unnamed protein product [Mycena citricolor]